MVVERSEAKAMIMSAGIAALSFGTSARTASTVLMILAPGWRKTMMRPRAGRPPVRDCAGPAPNPHVRHIAQPQRVAVAVGDDLVAVVGGARRLVRGVDLPAMRRRHRWRPWARWRWRSTAPSGRLRARCRKWKSFSGSSSTRTAGSAEPETKTWPTPEICDNCCASTCSRRHTSARASASST